MAEVKVVKPPKPGVAEFENWFASPLFRGGLFSMSPFALMKQFTEEMDRAFYHRPAGEGFPWEPAIEVKEKEGKWMVTADLPGMRPEDVKVHVEGNTLVMEGERKQEQEEKREGYFHSERRYGRFYRTLLLPENATADQIAAKFSNGVLEVTIPFAEAKAKRQEIPVKQEGKEEPKKAA